MSSKRISKIHLAAIRRVLNGADVLDRGLAGTLREIEQRHPTLIYICKPMGSYSAKDRHPYFGCIATKAGREALRASVKSVQSVSAN